MEKVVILSTELQANLVRIINTHTSRYTSSEMRRMRDCVLLAQAGDVLDRLQRFFQPVMFLLYMALYFYK